MFRRFPLGTKANVEKWVFSTYKELITDMIPVGVGLHQGSSLSPYLFAMIMDVLARGIKDLSPWCMLHVDDIVLCGTRSVVVKKKLEEWRMAMEDRGLKINRKEMVYLRFNIDGNLDGNSDINLQGQNLERVNTFKYLGATLAENGDLDAEMTQNTIGMEKLEEGIGNSVRPKSKFESQGESIQDSCKTSNDVWCRDLGTEESTREEVGCGGNEDVKMDEWSHQAGQN